jgi:hypothetical protein
VVTVAHHQPPALFVTFGDERGDVGVDLRLQRFGQHPTSALPDDLVDQRRRTACRTAVITRRGLGDYGEHGRAFPTDAPTSVLLANLS